MIRILRRGFLSLLAGAAAAGACAQELPGLRFWRLAQGRVESPSGPADAPLAVGSLQKPFVAQAWAQAHPGEPSPRFRCEGGAFCWLKRGHGDLGLSAALARSCNAYFRRLAEATPREDLAACLGRAGFAPAPADADEAIGLAGPGLVRIRPSNLLASYRELLKVPWPSGEPVRQEVLAGLRESALRGTAGGLGAWGFWAKTGTVPLDAQRTEGFALAMDEGTVLLARLSPGTGSQAAAALGPLAAQGSGLPKETPASGAVTVRLFDLLPLRGFTVRNAGSAPVLDGHSFLGPGAVRPLQPGDRLGPGLLEFQCESRGVRRRIEGRVEVRGGRILATLSRRAYVEGVLAAELPDGEPALRAELGASVLRFLARGRRHRDADVCDSTHCAWFVGQGPRLQWIRPGRAREAGSAGPPLGARDWEDIQVRAKAPGPAFWTAHCGGRPLSSRRVWGWGGPEAPSCPRHGWPSASWARTLSRRDVERAFGGGIQNLALTPEDGPWGLRVARREGEATYGYDEAHRRLADVAGWDALPSPASRVEVSGDQVRFSGEGQGHRVGLCLGK